MGAGRSRTVQSLRLNEQRLEALLTLSHMSEASLREIADFALEEGVVLTRSKIGYLAFMNDDETVLTMYTWSKEALRICTVPDKLMVYPIETTGLWGEAVRQRKAIITNDYAAPNAWKRGVPEGHVPVHRHMNVPVVDGGRIVLVAGVGNKDVEYDESDVRQLTLMMEGMWRILRRQKMEAELRNYRDHLEQLVAERTAEVAAAKDEIQHINEELQRQLRETSQAEAALRESEEKLRKINESALDAVVVIDSQGKVTYWNPAAERMFGYCEAEMVGRDAHAILVPPRDQKTAANGIRTFAETGKGFVVGKTLELSALRKDGSAFPIELSLAPFRMKGRWCASAIIRDITQRKRTEQQLIEANVRLSQEVEDRRRAEQALRSLLESSDRERQLISYDIHDGLAQQMAGAKMAFDAYGHLKRDRPEEGAAVYSEGLRLLDRALAEVRRLIGGLRPPILDEQGVVAAIEHFVHDTRNHLGLEIECHSDVGFYRLEPTLESALLRIVQEGVTNAHKHSRSNRIHIGLSQAGQLIRLEIRDWGVGFDPKATTAGFGLEGIRQRARLHGGDASVESSPGQGTLIVVNLPVVERKEDPGSPPGADAPHGAAVPSTG